MLGSMKWKAAGTGSLPPFLFLEDDYAAFGKGSDFVSSSASVT